jgi:hypothetical protein
MTSRLLKGSVGAVAVLAAVLLYTLGLTCATFGDSA